MDTLIHPDLQSLAQPVDSLSNLPGNPRRGDVDAVARSYQAFGQRKPIVARRADRTVIAGNHQLLAARALGWSEIAVVFVDDDDTTAGAFALADNRTSDLGEYDVDDLLALLQSVQGEASADLFAATGYNGDDVLALLASTSPKVVLTEVDSIPDAPTAVFSSLGDVWQMGEHRLICGDSTDRDTLRALMGDDLAHLVLTDPPYGVDYTGGTKNTTARRALMNDTTDVFAEALPLAHQFSTPDAALYLWFAGGKGDLAYSAVRASQYEVRAMIIWHKLRAHYGSFMAQYMPKHEPMIYCFKTGQSPKWRGPTNEVTVWEYDQPSRNDLHPTQKPVEPLVRAIENSSDPDDLVLDLFAGSGSTLIAAHSIGRHARLVELDPAYVDVICRRYQEHTGQLPVLERTGESHDFTTT